MEPLGSGGGPKEDNTTALLVRSTAQEWTKGSILAVDAGVQLGKITRILDDHLPDVKVRPAIVTSGPFKGLALPHASSAANAVHVTGTLVDTYLITHPHLDHISGFVVNTASLTRAKRLAGLPKTIKAFKEHIFNNIIWPNLSDENDGAGLVTYMRLVEGGSPALGNGDDKGYMEICDGLTVKAWSVSHGHCIEKHTHRGSSASLHPVVDAAGVPLIDASPLGRSISSGARSPKHPRNSRMSPHPASNYAAAYSQPTETREETCVYDSSAYFIRDIATGREILVFGDVEPDSISLHPRNQRVWIDAAPKVASGKLGGVFIECSYDDSQEDSMLFGHMAPRHLIMELRILATEVEASKQEQQETKKRKRQSNGDSLDHPNRRHSPRGAARQGSPLPNMQASPVSPLTQCRLPDILPPDNDSIPEKFSTAPLNGVKVVLIHIKEKLNDGPDEGDIILGQLKEYEEEIGLGCEFVISREGQAVFL
ncbi:hypothetical protein BP6252_07714 [Coleophoma cylindrospora]|uniref:Uncharacterized protein n=1 Tax=Coleophoma cylindrospora TaxID=1849047 RepID=A0A3D8RB93_9HELO|nr:hypothetical protein BP6252_07714 [Coleophoma cylindrospora]